MLDSLIRNKAALEKTQKLYPSSKEDINEDVRGKKPRWEETNTEGEKRRYGRSRQLIRKEEEKIRESGYREEKQGFRVTGYRQDKHLIRISGYRQEKQGRRCGQASKK